MKTGHYFFYTMYMDTARFGMLEENRLTRTYGSDIARKLLILGDINT